MSNIDKSLLKELDRQRLSGSIISSIMSQLDSNEQKYQFLSFMIKKRNTILSLSELFAEIKEIN